MPPVSRRAVLSPAHVDEAQDEWISAGPAVV
jgi:hypothetical protein